MVIDLWRCKGVGVYIGFPALDLAMWEVPNGLKCPALEVLLNSECIISLNLLVLRKYFICKCKLPVTYKVCVRRIGVAR
jgi:hypothetical protein